MNTQNNFFKTTGNKFNNGGDIRFNFNNDQPRVKTSSSPNRMPFIKDNNNNNYGRNPQNLKSPSLTTNYNIQNLNTMDTDKLKDELIKYKNELNKKSKEHHILKISFIKLDNENKKNIKVIEEILQEASRQSEKRFDENDSEFKNVLSNTYISSNNVSKLKEAHSINSLRKQVNDYKNILNSKDDEIDILKNNSKITKFHELDTKLKISLQDFDSLTERFTFLKMSFSEKEFKFKEVSDERDYYKTMMLRIKAQHDESKEKIASYLESTNKMNELIKSLEDKNSNIRFQYNSVKNKIKEKENIINTLKEEIAANEVFKNEKEKMEKNILVLNKNVQNYKDDMEKKLKRVKDLEKANIDLKEKVEFHFNENKKLSENSTVAKNINKGKQIKKIEEDFSSFKEENVRFREEIMKLKIENLKIKSELENKNEEFKTISKEKNTLQENNEVLNSDYERLPTTAKNNISNIENKKEITHDDNLDTKESKLIFNEEKFDKDNFNDEFNNNDNVEDQEKHIYEEGEGENNGLNILELDEDNLVAKEAHEDENYENQFENIEGEQ